MELSSAVPATTMEFCCLRSCSSFCFCSSFCVCFRVIANGVLLICSSVLCFALKAASRGGNMVHSLGAEKVAPDADDVDATDESATVDGEAARITLRLIDSSPETCSSSLLNSSLRLRRSLISSRAARSIIVRSRLCLRTERIAPVIAAPPAVRRRGPVIISTFMVDRVCIALGAWTAVMRIPVSSIAAGMPFLNSFLHGSLLPCFVTLLRGCADSSTISSGLALCCVTPLLFTLSASQPPHPASPHALTPRVIGASGVGCVARANALASANSSS